MVLSVFILGRVLKQMMRKNWLMDDIKPESLDALKFDRGSFGIVQVPADNV